MFAVNFQKSNNLATNTQQQFKTELMANQKLRSNQTFETASGVLRKNGSQLKQTKLSLCQKNKKLIFSGFVEETTKINPKHEFIYNSASKEFLKSFRAAQNVSKVPKIEPPAVQPTSPMSKSGRKMLSLIGRVDFCMKTNRMQAPLNAIWNIYGQLQRIVAGKRGEQTLLLRNEDKGPILQAIFYDFDGEVKTLTNGCYLKVVGRFVGENRLKTFSVSQVGLAEWQQNFTRAENVISYILTQNSTNRG